MVERREFQFPQAILILLCDGCFLCICHFLHVGLHCVVGVRRPPSSVLSLNRTSEDISRRAIPSAPPLPLPPTAPLVLPSPLSFFAARRQSILSPPDRIHHVISNPRTLTLLPLCCRTLSPLPLPLLLRIFPRPVASSFIPFHILPLIFLLLLTYPPPYRHPSPPLPPFLIFVR